MATAKISNPAVSCAPGGILTTLAEPTITPWTPPSPANLGRLYDLPPELRVMVYKAVMETDDAIPMVRSLVYSQDHQRFYILSNHAPYMRPPAWGLLTTIPEAFGEALRMGRVLLPAQRVIFPGASVAHPLVSEPVDVAGSGGSLYNPASTVFYLDHASIMALFRDAATTPTLADRFVWLTDLLLDRRTFEHLLWLPRPSSAGRRSVLPFASLPGLRRLVVGFLHRWQDVAVVEGPYRDVVEEVNVDIYYSANSSAAANPDDQGNEERSTDGDDGDEPTVERVKVKPRRLVHPVMKRIIKETVKHTDSSVRALNRAGVRVTWAVIRQGVTQRRDVMLGMHEVRR